jgi:hypothetical protein
MTRNHGVGPARGFFDVTEQAWYDSMSLGRVEAPISCRDSAISEGACSLGECYPSHTIAMGREWGDAHRYRCSSIALSAGGH